MRRTILSGAALTLGVAASLTTSVFADEQCPVDVLIDGGVAGHYAALQEAVDNAGNGIIKIAGACTVESPVTINKKVYIDGDYQTITFDATGKGGYQPLFNMVAGGAGSTFTNTKFDYKGDGEDDAVFYFGYGFDGAAEKETTILNNDFIGHNDNASGIITTYDAGVNNLAIVGNGFSNLKHGMFFNSLNDSIITGNSIKDIKYNAINIAGDSTTIPSENIEIADNIMTNIATAHYSEPKYASGVNVGANADKISITGNTIVMAFDDENAIVIADVQKDIDIEDNGDYADMTELAEAVEEARALNLDDYTDESTAELRALLEDSEYFLDGVAKGHLYAEQNAVDQLTLSIKRALTMIEPKVKAPDTGANQISSNSATASLAASAATGSVLALVALALKRKFTRR